MAIDRKTMADDLPIKNHKMDGFYLSISKMNQATKKGGKIIEKFYCQGIFKLYLYHINLF